MANMSYCRFENTAKALQDCIWALEEGKTTELSNYELRGLEDLLAGCHELVEYENEIESIIEGCESTDTKH
jgi:hypothetical protein